MLSEAAECTSMCSGAEVDFRTKNSLIHRLEATTSSANGPRRLFEPDLKKMVKEYSRSAADTCHHKPALIRNFSALKTTIEYLLDMYYNGEDSSYDEVFSFVSDRLRAVRQDMTIQRMEPEKSSELYQMMIPFYLHSEARCQTVNCSTYEWKIHTTQLAECFSRWEEDIADSTSPVDVNILTSSIFWNLHKPNVLQRVYEEIMDEVLMISDLAWIRRGVAKEIPEKIKLNSEEIKDLIAGGGPETTDQESGDEEGMETEEADKPKGLRGSGDAEDVDDGETDIEKKYLKEYEEGAKEDTSRGMRGIAMYSSNMEDPYVTTQVDSDEEEEKDEIQVRADDNMVAVAKIEKDDYTLEVYVYNEADKDWYCHHDYILDAPPLCLEAIEYDPGDDKTGKGNLVAVGTMKSEIHIWDLDIMNSVTPVVTLGGGKKTKRRKRDGSDQGHTDAVISLAWNRLTEHVLGSGGADHQVVLWDLDEAKPAQVIADRGSEVQSISWHPNESTFLLIGTMGGDVQVIDCRETSGTASAEWKLGSEVEKILWNHFNPFTAFAANSNGKLTHFDLRNPGQKLWEGVAHEGAVSGLTLSAKTKGLLATTGEDQMLNVWKVDDSNGQINKVHSEKLSIGPLHCAQFNPDVASVLTVGGTAQDLIRVIDLARYDPIVQAFGSQ